MLSQELGKLRVELLRQIEVLTHKLKAIALLNGVEGIVDSEQSEPVSSIPDRWAEPVKILYPGVGRGNYPRKPRPVLHTEAEKAAAEKTKKRPGPGEVYQSVVLDDRGRAPRKLWNTEFFNVRGLPRINAPRAKSGKGLTTRGKVRQVAAKGERPSQCLDALHSVDKPWSANEVTKYIHKLFRQYPSADSVRMSLISCVAKGWALGLVDDNARVSHYRITEQGRSEWQRQMQASRLSRPEPQI